MQPLPCNPLVNLFMRPANPDHNTIYKSAGASGRIQSVQKNQCLFRFNFFFFASQCGRELVTNCSPHGFICPVSRTLDHHTSFQSADYAPTYQKDSPHFPSVQVLLSLNDLLCNIHFIPRDVLPSVELHLKCMSQMQQFAKSHTANNPCI
ncbi:hypothetical protein GOP47_0012937 [Adiantum capillus-veneris]|uniref:Uncharacterized protein n=1 Tax=Adiantum capillus-veneris TaxID=13818 RepID=A0A9D4URU2_ADICA|nr:hypothetical protein GOP47_0012937 [Adiantum capillus-veneris]